MRQHVVWFQQFIDSSLFQDDVIANYFRSVAPAGVSSLYWLGAKLGIEPLLLAKLLPLPLALVTTGFVYYTTLAIVPVPLAGWLATLILNQHIWLNDDLVSATPRAFLYPLFAAFLYYTTQRSLIAIPLTVALLGLFYPQLMLVALVILFLQLCYCHGGKIYFSGKRRHWQIAILSTVTALSVIIPFMLNLSDYGPAITAEQMRSQPEYGVGSRNEYFGVHPIDFILNGSSGIRIPVFPSIIWAGFALPILRQWQLPIIRAITPHIRILLDLMVASVILYVLAHLFLLELHFPSRYMYHSWRFALAIASGIVLATLFRKGQSWWYHKLRSRQGWSKRETIAVRLIGIIAAIVMIVPLFPSLMIAFQGWVAGQIPAIYTYLGNQPPQTMVASLSPEANNIPAFSHYQTWVGREFALPHHPEYYNIMRDRASQLLQAYYTNDLSELQMLVKQTGIDFFLIQESAFEPTYLRQDWLLHSQLQPQVEDIIKQMKNGLQPAIKRKLSACQVVSTQGYVLIEANCL